MLAYVYDGEKNLHLKEVEKPSAKKKSAVIKVDATSICGTDLRAYRFGSTKINSGSIMGHESVGTIIEIGSEVSNFKVGDRVQIAPAIGCGQCHYCKKGFTNLCDSLKTIGFNFDGTFAEYMEIPAEAFEQDHVTKVPEGLPSEQAVLAEPIACVANAQEYLDIKEGDIVLVIGSGFIGSMHADLAFSKGAARVFMSELNDHRIKMAKKFLPRLEMIDSSKEDLKTAVMDKTSGRGVDVVIVACSVGPAQTDAMNVVAKRGRVSLFGGLPKETTGFIDSNIIHYKEVSVYGAHASTVKQNREMLNLIANGTLNVKPFIEKTFPLREIENAFKALNDESIVKAVLKPGE